MRCCAGASLSYAPNSMSSGTGYPTAANAEPVSQPAGEPAYRTPVSADGVSANGMADASRKAASIGSEPVEFRFLNRELTWLAFNRRVLAEAEDDRNPLLERLKFLAITASNLDEFFMKRIGGLKQQVAAGVHELTVDGRTPHQQIAECYVQVRDFQRRQRLEVEALLTALVPHAITVAAYEELAADEQASVREYYYGNIFPLVTPLAIDPAHPFPFVSNLSLNLLVTIRDPRESEPSMAR